VNRRLIVILTLLTSLTLIARALPDARTIDDAFITFRYSLNLLDGNGFVYNLGTQTLGTTTPLWALLMALAGGITGGRDFPHYAIALSALADAGSVAILYLLARRLLKNDWLAIFPAVLWAIAPMSVTFAVGGMETSLTIFWMLAATGVYVLVVTPHPPTPSLTQAGRGGENQHTAGAGAGAPLPKGGVRAEILIGIIAALGVLTRVDSVIWIAPLFIYQFIEGVRRRRLPLATWVAFAAVLLPVVLFSMAYFGSPLPNSVTAKRFAYRVEPMGAFAGMIRTYSNLYFAFDLFGATGTMISGLIVLVTAIFALVYAARNLPRAVPLLIYPFLYMIVFSALNPLMFRWYFAPPLPALILATFTGLWALLVPLAKTRARPVAYGVVGLYGVIAIASSLSAWTLHPDHGADRPAPEMAWHRIELLYRNMGEYLRDTLGVMAETRVASADIGAVGFFSGATIVDTVGLVTPQLARYYPIDPALMASDQNYAIPPELIYDTQPDFLVTMEGFIRSGLAQQEQFLSEYELILEFPTDFYGTGMQLWQRRGT
jgi:hypothetical protein